MSAHECGEGRLVISGGEGVQQLPIVALLGRAAGGELLEVPQERRQRCRRHDQPSLVSGFA
jgi:hypothetical protein